MNYKIIFFLLLGLDATVLLFQTSELSISYYEAKLLYGNFSFLQSIVQTSLYFFGNNDFALRLPMIVLHLLSAVLLFEISIEYLKENKNRLWLLAIFMLLPGVVSSSLIVNEAGLVIFGLFLFVYLYTRLSSSFLYILLFLYALASGGFMYLFLALMFYGAHKRQRVLFLYNFLLFSFSMYMYGIDTHGSPEGHFLDTMALYSAIFTPIIFIYIFYVLYRRYLTKEIDLLWFLGSTALILSLVLSFRQKVEVEHFAPYLIVALPLAAKTFSSSYRVRLKQFRKKYKTIFIVSLLFLLVNSSLVLLNKYLYLFLENPKKHFAYNMHIAKDLARNLHEKKIDCVDAQSKMSLRLKFYGISKCNEYILSDKDELGSKLSNVTISYKNKPVYSVNVTKVNKI
jgi:hypothetical protein